MLRQPDGDIFGAGVLAGIVKVPVNPPLTFYTRHGEVFSRDVRARGGAGGVSRRLARLAPDGTAPTPRTPTPGGRKNRSANGAMNTGALVVSLHDVSPQTREVFTAMLGELEAWGVERTSLLVIPDHHHRGHILADAAFCHWLESLAARGHEVVVHGYYHQRDPRVGETWKERFITRTYTRGEGEFYDLPKPEAAARLARALEDFRQLDIPAPRGFIAPAWLLANAAADAVREAGFRYTTYLTGVRDFALGESGRFIRVAIRGVQPPQRLAPGVQPRLECQPRKAVAPRIALARGLASARLPTRKTLAANPANRPALPSPSARH